jgi:hypothetical protein
MPIHIICIHRLNGKNTRSCKAPFETIWFITQVIRINLLNKLTQEFHLSPIDVLLNLIFKCAEIEHQRPTHVYS